MGAINGRREERIESESKKISEGLQIEEREVGIERKIGSGGKEKGGEKNRERQEGMIKG